MEQSARQLDSRRARRRAPAERQRPTASVEPTFASRYECKYIVDPIVLGDLRDAIRPFCEPDTYAARRPGYRYPVGSLYLDSDALTTYMQTVGGDRNRFKIRVRTYDDDPASPAFFEVKRKIDTIVSKRRAALPREVARELLRTGYSDLMDRLRPGVQAELDHVMSYVRLTEARPVLRVKYWREAYQATGNEPARVTVDTELCHAVTFDDELAHGGDRWVRTPVDGAILEIKFTERYPFWIHDLVQRLGLRQQAVPKYVMSMDHALAGGRISAVGIAGELLPPRGF